MSEEAGTGPGETPPLPLGFKVLVGLAGLYLLLRLVQIGAWLVDRLT